MNLQCFGILILASLCLAKKLTDPECNPSMKIGCPKIFQPLCANNDKTYANLCELCVRSYLNQESGSPALQIQYEGECSDGELPQNEQAAAPEQPNCEQYSLPGCNKMLRPVCGTNGRTYGNECMLCLDIKESGQNILTAHKGSCKENKYENRN